MYQIIIKKKAKKFIDKLPANERKWVVSAIEQLPNGEDIKKMQGHDELLRLRVGDYRIIYSVDNGELIVYVVDAGNRGDIYKRYRQGAIKITIKQKIESACAMAGITVTELGRRVGMSQANISKRLKVGKFTQEELEAMGKALGAQYKSGFYFPDGNKVE